MTEKSDELHCPLGRRLLVIAYDGVVVLAIWFAVTALLLPLSGNRAIEPGQAFYFLYPTLLLAATWLYLAVSWRYGGQTLGMKAWRVHLRHEGGQMSWQESGLRFITALAGLLLLGVGYLSSLLRADRRCWHDRISNTRLVVLPRRR